MKRKLFRNGILVVMSGSMLLTALSGCSKDTGTKKQSSSGQTITIVSSAGWVRDIDKELAKKYEEKSGNKIEWQISPADQYENVLNSKLSVGEGADIFYTRSGISISKYQPDKYMMDLSDQEWVGRYTDWAKKGVTYDGKVMQFQTWSVDGWGLLYDKAMFKEAGITEVPKDYASLKEACEKILAIGKTPIYEPGAAQWHIGIWLSGLTTQIEAEDSEFYSKLNKNSIAFSGNKDLETSLDQLMEMQNAGYFGQDFMSNTWEDMVAKMAEGNYAMGIVYTTFPAEVEALNAEKKQDGWGMFPIPLNDNQTFGVSAGGIGRCVNKDTKVTEAIFDYFDFLSQKENLTSYYEERKDLGPCSFTDIPGNIPPAYKEVTANSTGIGLTAEDGILYWDNTQVGELMQKMYLGSLDAPGVLDGIDELRKAGFGE